jgi:hypothetical protein
MSAYRYHSSRPTNWVLPRQDMDGNRRRMVYGPIQPMEEPSWLERLLTRH